MRDWNFYDQNKRETAWKFVPYLWEIETWDKKSRLSAANPFVPYLWEIETVQGYNERKKDEAVCTLPMRDWNAQFRNSSALSPMSLYLTYERLKHPRFSSINWVTRCLYLTYERLKHFAHFRHLPILKSLYLTYERLKQLGELANEWRGFKVCTLPMRDWNLFFFSFSPSSSSFVCTLPMRDWNTPMSQKPNGPGTFVPYLWEIETLRIRTAKIFCKSLYLTYERLKPH